MSWTAHDVERVSQRIIDLWPSSKPMTEMEFLLFQKKFQKRLPKDVLRALDYVKMNQTRVGRPTFSEIESALRGSSQSPEHRSKCVGCGGRLFFLITIYPVDELELVAHSIPEHDIGRHNGQAFLPVEAAKALGAKESERLLACPKCRPARGWMSADDWHRCYGDTFGYFKSHADRELYLESLKEDPREPRRMTLREFLEEADDIGESELEPLTETLFHRRKKKAHEPTRFARPAQRTEATEFIDTEDSGDCREKARERFSRRD